MPTAVVPSNSCSIADRQPTCGILQSDGVVDGHCLGAAAAAVGTTSAAAPPVLSYELPLGQEDRATLRSDLSAWSGSRRVMRRRGVASGNAQNIGRSAGPTEAHPDESESVKPSLPPTSLDTLETSRHLRSTFLVNTLRPAADKVVDFLERQGSYVYLKAIEAIDGCARDHIVYSRGGVLRFSPAFCRERICPICAANRAGKLKKRLAATIRRMREPKLMTLTMVLTDASIDVLARRIKGYLVKLRRRKFFRNVCRSGFWIVEYTWREQTHCWHVHLHCVIDSAYLPQAWLSSAWSRITGGSTVVDIRQCNSRAAGYLAKYVSKNGWDLPPENRLKEWFMAVKSTRMFGSWGGIRIEETDLELPADCEIIGFLSAIIARARAGSQEDIDIIVELAAGILAEDRAPPGSNSGSRE